MMMYTCGHMLETRGHYGIEYHRVLYYEALSTRGSGRGSAVLLVVEGRCYSSIESSAQQAQGVQGVVLDREQREEWGTEASVCRL